jgi:hypothetical protein
MSRVSFKYFQNICDEGIKCVSYTPYEIYFIQGDPLSPLVFNSDLEYAIKKAKIN